MSGYSSLLIDIHQTAERKPVLSLVQGTDTVGQLMGEHRNHAVGQIHAGSSLERFLV